MIRKGCEVGKEMWEGEPRGDKGRRSDLIKIHSIHV